MIMDKQKHQTKTKDAEVKKENQDFPNIPASSAKIHSEKMAKKEIKETSKLHDDGKTDNTEKSEN